jgi:hypothetical protein
LDGVEGCALLEEDELFGGGEGLRGCQLVVSGCLNGSKGDMLPSFCTLKEEKSAIL